VKNVIILFLFLLCTKVQSQEVVKMVTLDEFIISAEPEMNQEDFIMRVVSDSSFYQAYLNMRYYAHQFSSNLTVYNKGEKEKANLYREATQHAEDDLVWVSVDKEKLKGKLKNKKGEHIYLTAEMYDDVFFSEEKYKASNVIGTMEQDLSNASKMEKYKSQLKKMLFNPGQEINSVPFIGDKVAIFSDEMVQYYNFNIYLREYQGREVYAFDITEKEGNKSNDTVIKTMISYFDKETMSVLMREYKLVTDIVLFEFDITIRVENELLNNELVPSKMFYDGEWNVLFKKPEIIKFDIECTNWVID
jgi:hypothetical protein